MAEAMAAQIEQGVFLPGDRLPGVRKLARQFGVSVSTAIGAVQLLEDRGFVQAKERSGYYVRLRASLASEQPAISAPVSVPVDVTGAAMALQMVRTVADPGIIQFGAAVPHPDFLPFQGVKRALATTMRRHADALGRYDFPPGNLPLRKQIARHMAEAGCHPDANDIVITSGCQEALTLCLRAATRPGDVVAVESPTFYGLLQVIEALGLKALEIPTDPIRGISLEALTMSLELWPVKACVLVPTHSNPLGYCMDGDSRRRLLAILEQYDIPLIEDDIYGDLSFSDSRPRAIKADDRHGNVLYCSSFSKTVSPGMRIGWAIPGKYVEKVNYLKYVLNLSTPSFNQAVMAEYLQQGGYERHVRSVRRQYERHVTLFIDAIARYFPQGTKVTQPRGGFVVWIELPKGCDSLEIHRQALTQRINIAPGPMFSATGKYRNYIRINCAQPWNPETEQALAKVGALVAIQASAI